MLGFVDAPEKDRHEVWRAQREILESIRDYNNVATKSGQKTGKSTSAVVTALWWVKTRGPRARVIITASSDDQIRNVLWKEMRRVYAAAKGSLGGECALDHRTGARWPDGREIIGLSVSKPENFAGLSSPHMLIIADEASGIEDPMWEAIEGNRAGGAKLLMISNPTRTSGKFYRAFTTESEFWHRITISSEEAATVGTPGLATPEYIDQRKREWGESSPLYQVRILGNFAEEGSDNVINIALVDQAAARWEATEADGPLEIGVDVARFGSDESVICSRRGYKIFPLVAFQGLDTQGVVGRVRHAIRTQRRQPTEPVRVKVDTVGVGGGVADALRDDDNVEVIDVNSSEAALDPEEYSNRRAELHFGGETFLKEGGALPDDARLHAELVAPHYGFDTRGRRKVESKDEIKKRIQRSPDRADAFHLAVWSPKNPRGGGRVKYKPKLSYSDFGSTPMGGLG